MKNIINLCKHSKIWEFRFRFCNKNKIVEYIILKVFLTQNRFGCQAVWFFLYRWCTVVIFPFYPTNKSSITYEKSLSWSQEKNFHRYKIFKGRLYDWKQISYLPYFTFQPFKRNILPSDNELLEKQVKTIIMSITITINNMFKPFKRNISFILYNNSVELNILFKKF